MLIHFPAAQGARQLVFCCSLLSATMCPGEKSRGTGTAVRAEGSRGVGSGEHGCALLCSGGLLVLHTDVTPHGVFDRWSYGPGARFIFHFYHSFWISLTLHQPA